LARAELERGHTAEAIAALERVLKEHPQSTEARMLRGLIDFQSEKYASALMHFQKARPTTSSERVFLLYHIGVSLDRLGRVEEAKQAFGELRAVQSANRHGDDARQRPDDIDLQIRAAASYLAAKQPDAAYRLIQDALARTGGSRRLLLAMAESCDALGRTEEARQARLDAERAP
jgi:tetratricopeptide (TPR) repeat protein